MIDDHLIMVNHIAARTVIGSLLMDRYKYIRTHALPKWNKLLCFSKKVRLYGVWYQ